MTPVCPVCSDQATELVAELGLSPLPRDYREPGDAAPTLITDIRVHRCEGCGSLVRTPSIELAALQPSVDRPSFRSAQAVQRVERGTDAILAATELPPQGLVVGVGSTDGYRLDAFRRRGFPVLGIEASGARAAVAKLRGIPTIVGALDPSLAEQLRSSGIRASVMLVGPALTWSSQPTDVMAAMTRLLAPAGTIVVETTTVGRLWGARAFGRITAEHAWVPSVQGLAILAQAHGLSVVTHHPAAGTAAHSRVLLRAGRSGADWSPPSEAWRRTAAADVARARERWLTAAVSTIRAARRHADVVVGIGASADAATLLTSLSRARIDAVLEVNHFKQGTLLPGTDVAIRDGLPADARVAMLSLPSKRDARIAAWDQPRRRHPAAWMPLTASSAG